MKRLILLMIGVTMFWTTMAWADPFQLIERASGVYASHSPVLHNGKVIGYTDMYGRIEIGSPQGTQTFYVNFKGQNRRVDLSIVGNTRLKMAYF